MISNSDTRTFAHGDLVVCTDIKGGRWNGTVLRVFADGSILVDAGTGKRNRRGYPDRDVRAFDAKQVERA